MTFFVLEYRYADLDARARVRPAGVGVDHVLRPWNVVIPSRSGGAGSQ